MRAEVVEGVEEEEEFPEDEEEIYEEYEEEMEEEYEEEEEEEEVEGDGMKGQEQGKEEGAVDGEVKTPGGGRAGAGAGLPPQQVAGLAGPGGAQAQAQAQAQRQGPTAPGFMSQQMMAQQRWMFGGAGAAQQFAMAKAMEEEEEAEGEVRNWIGMDGVPEETQAVLRGLMDELKGEGREEVTVLMVGKNNVGKSSVANTLFSERVFRVDHWDNEMSQPEMQSRVKDGFTLHVVDTPGLVDGDGVDDGALDVIKEFLVDRPIDCVLYVDRLDAYRVDGIDYLALDAVTRTFGRRVWDRTVLVLTHGQFRPPSSANTEDVAAYTAYCKQRVRNVRDAVAEVGRVRAGAADVPVAIVENSTRCKVNRESQRVLPDDQVVLTTLFGAVAKVALENEPFEFDESDEPGHRANRFSKLWVPLAALIQVFLVRGLVGTIRDDNLYDRHGD